MWYVGTRNGLVSVWLDDEDQARWTWEYWESLGWPSEYGLFSW